MRWRKGARRNRRRVRHGDAATVLDGVTAGHAALSRRELRPDRRDHPRADEEEAVRIANDSEYGLSAAVFTPRRGARPSGGATHRIGHLPRQRRRPCRTSRKCRSAAPARPATAGSAARPAIDGLHRAALDHDRGRTRALSHLISARPADRPDSRRPLRPAPIEAPAQGRPSLRSEAEWRRCQGWHRHRRSSATGS